MTQQPDELADRTAAELAVAYRSGAVSPVEVARAVLQRIEASDGALNAYCLVDADVTLEMARASEQRWHAGNPLSAIDGVPTSIKDLFLTKDWPTLRGSKTVDPAGPWEVDAPAVARLREAGAVFTGKTTTPELGWKGVTDGPLTGVTRNPWDPSRTAGGSSGGAAAAVVAGMGPLALGTDGGGSVRIPGSFCGAVGFKPTYGTVPMYPPSPYGTLAHVGPITRTVRDAAMLLDAITGPDSRDWSALAPPQHPFTADLATPLAGLRIAYSRDLGFVTVDPEVAALVENAAEVLASLGAEIVEVDPGFDDPVDEFECLWFAGAAKATAHLTDAQRAGMDAGLAQSSTQGLTYSAQDYLNAMERRMNMGVQMGAFHETYDLLITPAMPIPAFEAGVEVPAGWPGHRWTRWAPFSYPFNMTQQPAISVPCGFTDAGLPVGLQIVGPRHADGRVLAAAHHYEDATGWWRTRPPRG
ncbi:amidase [Tomitella biformata]|uniref:amidase n=1 Tax=Tomitella biformata TaxID=630403 RepID=UPI0004662A58|nr:amidase [Tomitella biformata]